MINETEMTRGSNNGHGANLMFAFLTGASIGAAAGLLLAPCTGRESRGQVRNYFQKTREKLRSAVRESSGRVRETASRVGSAAADVAGLTSSAAHSLEGHAKNQ